MPVREYKSCCNFMNNPRAKLADIVATIEEACSRQCPKGEHVLVMQDTTEVNYSAHEGRFKITDPDLGVLSNGRYTGLWAHAGLAVSATTQLPFGLCHVEVNHRPFVRAIRSNNEREKLPLQEKASYRWWQTVHKSRLCLPQASQVTIIGDRESDIYELFSQRPDQHTHILVRSNADRITADGVKISTALSKQPWDGCQTIELAGNQHRHGRMATLRFRWCSLVITPSAVRKKLFNEFPQTQVWAIQIEEIPASVPIGEQPIHWRLLTTHPVESLQMAQQVTQWYVLRWLIEELFRILKQGLNVEQSQFETGIALKKLLTLSLEASWKIVLMKQERRGEKQLAASCCFNKEQIQVLKALQPTLEGKTYQQQNPFSKESLAWAAWLIARLGGWKPAPLDKRPFGVISLCRGMQTFNKQFQGWLIAMTMLQDPNSFPT